MLHVGGLHCVNTTMQQSSSSLSEDDVPIQQRLRLKEQRAKKKPTNVDKTERNCRPPQRAKKFVIPRKKKARELFETQNLDTRDAKDLLRTVTQSFYQPNLSSMYNFEKVTIVHNTRLYKEFSIKKQAMRQGGCTQKEVEDSHAYLFLDSWDKVKAISKEGLVTDSSSLTALGDPKMGVYLSRFPDLISPQPPSTQTEGFLMVFKVAKGKLKAVGERTGHGCALEPTPNYDGHISKLFPPGHKVTMVQAFVSSQYYFYEFMDDGDEIHSRRPRQCCPYAVVQYSITCSQSLYKDLPMWNYSNTADPEPLMNMQPSVDGRMYPDYARYGRTLWSGVVKNKENTLSKAELICYSNDELPFSIGEYIDIKAKVGYEKLQPLLPSPIFSQLPVISAKCKAFDNRTMYVYCEIKPQDGNTKLAKLISYFQGKNLAGVAEFPESDAHIYVIPTSDFTHHLGLTDQHYPDMLHALLMKRLPKEDPQSHNRRINKMSTDPVAEAAVIRDIRKELQQIHFQQIKKITETSSDDGKTLNGKVVVSSFDKENTNDAEEKSTCTESSSVSLEYSSKDSTKTSASIVNEQDIFKSPPQVQTHPAVFDTPLMSRQSSVKYSSQVTRHFMDPRLAAKATIPNPCSQVEVESLLSDNSTKSSPSFISKTPSKTGETPAEPSTALKTCSGPVTSESKTLNSGTENFEEKESKPSRLSARLTALFAKTSRRSPVAAVVGGPDVPLSTSIDTVSSNTPFTTTTIASLVSAASGQWLTTKSSSTATTSVTSVSTTLSQVPSMDLKGSPQKVSNVSLANVAKSSRASTWGMPITNLAQQSSTFLTSSAPSMIKPTDSLTAGTSLSSPVGSANVLSNFVSKCERQVSSKPSPQKKVPDEIPSSKVAVQGPLIVPRITTTSSRTSVIPLSATFLVSSRNLQQLSSAVSRQAIVRSDSGLYVPRTAVGASNMSSGQMMIQYPPIKSLPKVLNIPSLRTTSSTNVNSLSVTSSKQLQNSVTAVTTPVINVEKCVQGSPILLPPNVSRATNGQGTTFGQSDQSRNLSLTSALRLSYSNVAVNVSSTGTLSNVKQLQLQGSVVTTPLVSSHAKFSPDVEKVKTPAPSAAPSVTSNHSFIEPLRLQRPITPVISTASNVTSPVTASGVKWKNTFVTSPTLMLPGQAKQYPDPNVSKTEAPSTLTCSMVGRSRGIHESSSGESSTLQSARELSCVSSPGTSGGEMFMPSLVTGKTAGKSALPRVTSGFTESVPAPVFTSITTPPECEESEGTLSKLSAALKKTTDRLPSSHVRSVSSITVSAPVSLSVTTVVRTEAALIKSYPVKSDQPLPLRVTHGYVEIATTTVPTRLAESEITLSKPPSTLKSLADQPVQSVAAPAAAVTTSVLGFSSPITGWNSELDVVSNSGSLDEASKSVESNQSAESYFFPKQPGNLIQLANVTPISNLTATAPVSPCTTPTKTGQNEVFPTKSYTAFGLFDNEPQSSHIACPSTQAFTATVSSCVATLERNGATSKLSPAVKLSQSQMASLSASGQYPVVSPLVTTTASKEGNVPTSPDTSMLGATGKFSLQKLPIPTLAVSNSLRSHGSPVQQQETAKELASFRPELEGSFPGIQSNGSSANSVPNLFHCTFNTPDSPAQRETDTTLGSPVTINQWKSEGVLFDNSITVERPLTENPVSLNLSPSLEISRFSIQYSCPTTQNNPVPVPSNFDQPGNHTSRLYQRSSPVNLASSKSPIHVPSVSKHANKIENPSKTAVDTALSKSADLDTTSGFGYTKRYSDVFLSIPNIAPGDTKKVTTNEEKAFPLVNTAGLEPKPLTNESKDLCNLPEKSPNEISGAKLSSGSEENAEQDGSSVPERSTRHGKKFGYDKMIEKIDHQRSVLRKLPDSDNEERDSEEAPDELLEEARIHIVPASYTFEISSPENERSYSPISSVGFSDDGVASMVRSGESDNQSLSGLSTISEYRNTADDTLELSSISSEDADLNYAESIKSEAIDGKFNSDTDWSPEGYLRYERRSVKEKIKQKTSEQHSRPRHQSLKLSSSDEPGESISRTSPPGRTHRDHRSSHKEDLPVKHSKKNDKSSDNARHENESCELKSKSSSGRRDKECHSSRSPLRSRSGKRKSSHSRTNDSSSRHRSRGDKRTSEHRSRHRSRGRSRDRSCERSRDRKSKTHRRHRTRSSSAKRHHSWKIRCRSNSSSSSSSSICYRRRGCKTSKTGSKGKIDLSDETILLEITKPGVIERLQDLLQEQICRALNEVPNYLGNPGLSENNLAKSRPFFGGIRDIIYGPRPEPETVVVQDPNCKSVVVESLRKRPATEVDGEDLKRSSEFENISPNCGCDNNPVTRNGRWYFSSKECSVKNLNLTDTIGTVNSVRGKCSTERSGNEKCSNCRRYDVDRDIFNGDQVDEMRNDEDRNFDEGLQNKCESELIPSSPTLAPLEPNGNESIKTDLSFSPKYIATFKAKRRNHLIRQMRALRTREKAQSTEINLAKLDLLRNDIKKLTATMEKVKNQHAKGCSKGDFVRSNTELTTGGTLSCSLETKCEQTSSSYRCDKGKSSTRSGSDHNVMSMEMSEGDAGSNEELVRRCEVAHPGKIKGQVRNGMQTNTGPSTWGSISGNHSPINRPTSTSPSKEVSSIADGELEKTQQRCPTVGKFFPSVECRKDGTVSSRQILTSCGSKVNLNDNSHRLKAGSFVDRKLDYFNCCGEEIYKSTPNGEEGSVGSGEPRFITCYDDNTIGKDHLNRTIKQSKNGLQRMAPNCHASSLEQSVGKSSEKQKTINMRSGHIPSFEKVGKSRKGRMKRLLPQDGTSILHKFSSPSEADVNVHPELPREGRTSVAPHQHVSSLPQTTKKSKRKITVNEDLDYKPRVKKKNDSKKRLVKRRTKCQQLHDSQINWIHLGTSREDICDKTDKPKEDTSFTRYISGPSQFNDIAAESWAHFQLQIKVVARNMCCKNFSDESSNQILLAEELPPFTGFEGGEENVYKEMGYSCPYELDPNMDYSETIGQEIVCPCEYRHLQDNTEITLTNAQEINQLPQQQATNIVCKGENSLDDQTLTTQLSLVLNSLTKSQLSILLRSPRGANPPLTDKFPGAKRLPPPS